MVGLVLGGLVVQGCEKLLRELQVSHVARASESLFFKAAQRVLEGELGQD